MEILLLDDNECVCKMVEKALMEIGTNGNFHIAHDYESAQKIINEFEIDLAFLDIEISQEKDGKSGLDFSKELHQKSPKTKVIFVTSYPVYALNAYEVHPYDFIVKPVDIERLKSSAKRAIEEIERLSQLKQDEYSGIKGDRLIIRTNKEMIFMPYDEILFFEKIGKEVIIHTEKSQINVRWTLSELEDMLPREFVRVHKSFLVQASKITRIVEFGDRTYEIFFGNHNKTAILSRYKVNDLFQVMEIQAK